MKIDRFITIVPDGNRHRYQIDRGTHTLQSKKTFASKAEAMGDARKACARLTFDLSLYPAQRDVATLRKHGLAQRLSPPKP